MRGSGQGGGRSFSSAVIDCVLFFLSFLSMPVPQAGANPEARPKPETGVTVQLAPQTAAWYLELMRRLLHQGRAAEAYQLAQLAVAQFPKSPDVRLGAAFAAVATGRCRLASRHLALFREDDVSGTVALGHQRRHDMLRAECDGPWTRSLVIETTAGYRPSLSDRERQFEARVEPGSRIHGLCLRLRGLCDPNRPFTGKAARDSGIDMWIQFRFPYRYRAGTAWDVDVTPLIFRRQQSRSGHQGRGAILRVEGWRHLRRGSQLYLFGEVGTSGFQQGDPALAFTQSHRRLRAAYTMPHTPRMASQIGHSRTRVRSKWLDLRQRRYDYRLYIKPNEGLTFWAGIAAEGASQSGISRLAGSRLRSRSVGAQQRIPGVTLSAWHEIRHQRFTKALSYLAVPHSDTTRITGLDLIPKLPKALNLKVVISFSHRKISSPDVLRPKITKTLMFTVRYAINNRT